MELTPAAEDALLALFAVKGGIVSEGRIEKVLARQAEDGRPLREHLVETKALTPEQLTALLAQLDPLVIPGYRIEGEAGRGGMGVVYRAIQLSMERTVALKVLSRRLARDASYVAKFLAEARAAAKLNHENIVAAIDAGEANGLYFFAMEFVDGTSVADLLAEQERLPWERAFELAEQVARALGHAHGAGLVHRDVKPENVMIGADGRAKLCDLGLAKPLQPAGTGEKAAMTEGTPYYCSPEQALGRTDIDARSDIYSLGATLFHMLAGEPPFDGDSARAILVHQVRTPFPSLAERLPDVPAPLRELLDAMVVKEREGRLPDARAFEERLAAARRAAARPPAGARLADAVRASGRGGGLVALGGLVGAAVLVAGAWALLTGGAEPGDGEPGDAPAHTADARPEPTPAPPTPTRPEVRRVDRAEPAEGPPPPPPPAADPEGAGLLAAAQAYGREHPDDPWGALLLYRELLAARPTLTDATRAEVAALEAAVQRAGDQAYEALTLQVLELVRAQRFEAALGLIETFRATWSGRALDELPARLDRVERPVRQQATAALEQALAGLREASEPAAAAKARAALEELAGRLPRDLAERARAALDAARRAEALERWQAAAEGVMSALCAGRLAEAEQALAAAEPLAGPAGKGAALAALQADLDGVRRAEAVFVRTWQGLVVAGGGVTLRRREGELSGRLVRFDPKSWLGALAPAGGGEATFDVRELDPDELLSRALPAREGRFNALLFLGRGAGGAAEAAFAAAVAAGVPEDPALRERIAAAAADARERAALAWIATLTAPGVSPSALMAALREPPQDVRRAAAFAERWDQLQAAYREARRTELLEDPRRLFGGAAQLDRKGRLSVRYTFADDVELTDWTPDATVSKEARIGREDGDVVVRGKVLHRARFSSGELEVEAKLVPLEGPAANANVLISSRPGWRGVLFGAGFSYPSVPELRLDAAAPDRAGQQVGLPAHVVVVLDGRAPSARMKWVLAASERPELRARSVVRVQITRNERGQVRYRLGTRTVTAQGPIPRWDDAGQVGLAPFGGAVIVKEIELKGQVDPAWLTTEAVAVVAREAAALPGPLVE